MAKQKVTLQCNLSRGVFYWVAEVEAASDDEAVVAAENLFLAEMDNAKDWTFNDFSVEDA